MFSLWFNLRRTKMEQSIIELRLQTNRAYLPMVSQLPFSFFKHIKLGPFVETVPCYPKNDSFRDFLLTKCKKNDLHTFLVRFYQFFFLILVINAERAAILYSPDFKRKDTRTRKECLKEFAETYGKNKGMISFRKRGSGVSFLISKDKKTKSNSMSDLGSSTARETTTTRLEAILNLCNQGLTLIKENPASIDSTEMTKIWKQVSFKSNFLT